MSLQSVLNSLPEFHNEEILKSFIKGYSIVNRPQYKNIVCSVSGGSDSDIMLDIIHRIDEHKKVIYVWFDTGVEYKATKNHLEYLESRYGVTIQRNKAIKPIPLCVKQYGQPFLSKYVSEQINRLQRAGFQWEDETFEVLVEKYPGVKGSLRWWTNSYKERFKEKNGKKENANTSIFDINRNSYLKEFLIANPPSFKISSECCNWAKKKVSHKIIEEGDYDLSIIGVRKLEGGIRSVTYKNCYTSGEDTIDQYRPLFWFSDNDKKEYEKAFSIQHSACYSQYGFRRTGCVCCPYGRELEYELKQTKKYEPIMYKAVSNIFKDSYEYTWQYREFQKGMRELNKEIKKGNVTF